MSSTERPERVVAIHQPQYLPWLGYFDKMFRCDHFILLDDVQFVKNEWKNRNRIKGANGYQWLTVPVVHRFAQKILDVEIADVSWKRKHLQAIRSNYGRAPFFEEFFPWFERALALESNRLVEYCSLLIETIAQIFGYKGEILRSSGCPKTEERTLRLLDLCRGKEATTYLSGPAGQNYLDADLFAEAGIEVKYHVYKHPQYEQIFGDFVANCSVIDLLFNHGQDSLAILLSGGEKTGLTERVR